MKKSYWIIAAIVAVVGMAGVVYATSCSSCTQEEGKACCKKTRPHKPPTPNVAIAMAHAPAKVAVANARPSAMPQATVYVHQVVPVAIAKPHKVQPLAKL